MSSLVFFGDFSPVLACRRRDRLPALRGKLFQGVRRLEPHEAERFVRPHDGRPDGDVIVAPHAARAKTQAERLDIVRGSQHEKH